MNKVWITSDWHFGHAGIIIGQSVWTKATPFRQFDSVQHMDDTIIDNINAVVGRKDTLWCLGDVIFSSPKNLPLLRNRIVCKDIRLIFGNHDQQIMKNRDKLFSWVGDYKKIRHNNNKIFLFHYPIYSWDCIHHGSIQLYGHCHDNLPDTGKRQMDVGIDTNNYKPYLLDDVVEKMLARPVITAGDHHENN